MSSILALLDAATSTLEEDPAALSKDKHEQLRHIIARLTVVSELLAIRNAPPPRFKDSEILEEAYAAMQQVDPPADAEQGQPAGRDAFPDDFSSNIITGESVLQNARRSTAERKRREALILKNMRKDGS